MAKIITGYQNDNLFDLVQPWKHSMINCYIIFCNVKLKTTVYFRTGIVH